MRKFVLAATAAAALVFLPAAQGQVFSLGIATPGLSIGINMPAYPALVQIPGYPVYWDPRAPYNYFFYDGLYWVFIDDNWYSSEWYDGPWRIVGPQYVPAYILRVPVRYYRHPPPYFRRWAAAAPPHWGERWGPDWERQRRGWNRWDRRAVPAPAPLPQYQRQFRGERYPRAIEQQQQIREQRYRYRPREPVARQHFGDRPPAPRERVPLAPDRGRPPPQPYVQPQAQPQPPQRPPRMQPPPQVQRAPQPQAEPRGRGPQPQAEPRGRGPDGPERHRGERNRPDDDARDRGR